MNRGTKEVVVDAVVAVGGIVEDAMAVIDRGDGSWCRGLNFHTLFTASDFDA